MLVRYRVRSNHLPIRFFQPMVNHSGAVVNYGYYFFTHG